jgi:threonine/homoserine/homoserine lactone efflux protein
VAVSTQEKQIEAGAASRLLGRPWLAPAAIVAGVVLAFVGLMYAAALGISSAHHPKHAILFFVLALGALVIAWFSAGERSRARSRESAPG